MRHCHTLYESDALLHSITGVFFVVVVDVVVVVVF